MPEKDPTWWPWATSLVISFGAAIAQYAQRVRAGLTPQWGSFWVDAAICLFVGMVTGWLCDAYGIEGNLRNAMIAINAHMGTRAVMQWERLRNRVFGFGK